MSTADDVRFARLRATLTFAGSAHDRWCASTLAVVGAGAVGGPFAREAARSGARLRIYDLDVGEAGNQGNQQVVVGEPKAASVAGNCNSIAAECAEAYVTDIRSIGPGAFEDVALIVDCTDDPALAPALTGLSNGWAVPMIRLAVDGTGRQELARMLVSHGGAGHACQLCGESAKAVDKHWARTPCGGVDTPTLPTNAGSALAMTVAGFGLLWAQRLIGGGAEDEVLDREVYIDLETPRFLPMQLTRSDPCLSGHRRFDPVRTGLRASEATLGDLFALGSQANGGRPVTLEIPGQPILLGATCTCGRSTILPGTRWAPVPDCERCGKPTERVANPSIDRLNEEQARVLGILDAPAEQLGLARRGALLFVRAGGRPAQEFLLD